MGHRETNPNQNNHENWLMNIWQQHAAVVERFAGGAGKSGTEHRQQGEDCSGACVRRAELNKALFEAPLEDIAWHTIGLLGWKSARSDFDLYQSQRQQRVWGLRPALRQTPAELVVPKQGSTPALTTLIDWAMQMPPSSRFTSTTRLPSRWAECSTASSTFSAFGQWHEGLGIAARAVAVTCRTGDATTR